MEGVRRIVWCTMLGFLAWSHAASASGIDHLQGEMAGEVTAESAILQTRLTASGLDGDGDVPGVAGVARFEYGEDERFSGSRKTRWQSSSADRDYIVREKISGLKPDTRYYYRVIFGADSSVTNVGPTRFFRTNPGPHSAASVSLVVTTGMNYAKFQKKYTGMDKDSGFPALAAIRSLAPDYFIGTGDNIYYDSPRTGAARTRDELRKKWHEQFVKPRFVALFGALGTYWEKDDHDYRYDDADTVGSRAPSHALGVSMFREQMPVVDPGQPHAPTYRTHRISKTVQVWLLEGRDYRSPNTASDQGTKTIWGDEQREWLKRTLLASDAPVKLIVSPTPMVGPDDTRKDDNHVNGKGFRGEGDRFFWWAHKHNLKDKGLHLVCGDRHWQYHAVHPSGIEEFSCGALVDANARKGVRAGTGTDSDTLIEQPYLQRQSSGGFLLMEVGEPERKGLVPLSFRYYNEYGVLLYVSSRLIEAGTGRRMDELRLDAHMRDEMRFGLWHATRGRAAVELLTATGRKLFGQEYASSSEGATIAVPAAIERSVAKGWYTLTTTLGRGPLNHRTMVMR